MSNNNQKRSARIKPEQVIVAKKVAKPKSPPPKPTPKNHHKRRSLLKSLFSKKLKPTTFVSIVIIVFVVSVVVVGIMVSKSVKQTNISLDHARSTSDSMYLLAKKEADVIKLIGSKPKRQLEIINYQSAPTELQAFAEKDYKEFKQQCIINGNLSANVSYEIANVIYDKYAVVKRSCDGSELSILKKFDNKWAVVFSGNNLPSCSIVNDMDIPQGATMYCDQNGVQYLNPNP